MEYRAGIVAVSLACMVGAGVTALAAQDGPTPQPGQEPAAACLHGARETARQQARRLAAEQVAGVITFFNRSFPTPSVTRQRLGPDGQASGPPEIMPPPPEPDWWTRADFGLRLRDYAGPVREWGEQIAWGTDEPLPEWRIEWSVESDRYTFALVDTLDPCEFEVRPGNAMPRPPAEPNWQA